MTVLLTMVALQASAQTPSERAAERFEAGAQLYDEGAYDDAIAAFREALALSGRAELHFNLANCHERLNELEDAYNELNLYRAVAPSEERPILDRRLASIRERIEDQKLSLPAPVQIAVPVPVLVRAPPPVVEPRPLSWALLAGGGAVGAASLGGLAVSYTVEAEQPGTARALSWLGLAAGAGLGLAGVLTADTTVVVGPGTVGLEVVR